MKLFLAARRSGYGPEDCGKTMTAGELIEFLSQFDKDTELYIAHDGGYTFGEIVENSFFDGTEYDYLDEE